MVAINLYLEPSSDRSLVYYPGQLLKGTVELTLDTVKSFRGFHVTVHGEARAHWTETRTRTTGSGKDRRTTTYTVHFEGKEVYLNSRTYLFGQSGGPTFDIQPGVHKYNFACQLPDQLPYTMDAAHGNIYYYVEAVLDIPWRFDKEIKTSFTVVRHDDLNLYPDLKIGQRFEEVKNFCCLFCQSGPLLVQVTLPYVGFAKGQSIPVKIEYSNKSNVDIMNTRIKLKRSINYTSQTPHEKTRTDTEKMVEVMGPGLRGGENKSFDCALDIPGIMMNSNALFCRTVRLEYYVEVEATVDGCHTNPVVTCPVVIGSVPLMFDNQTQMSDVQPQIPAFQPTAPMQEPPKDDLPPSFEEALKMPMSQTPYMPQPTSSNLGWNVSAPSGPSAPSAPMAPSAPTAPLLEKS